MLSYLILFLFIVFWQPKYIYFFLCITKAITLALKTHLTHTHTHTGIVTQKALALVLLSRSHACKNSHTHRHTLQGVCWHLTTAHSVMTALRSLPDTSQTDWLLIFKTADNEFKARPLALAYLWRSTIPDDEGGRQTRCALARHHSAKKKGMHFPHYEAEI